ncbi:hypothetical protein [Nocardia sp. NPDC051463]|uniref:hypothetical protein n=1 Tax=Nocardia sp. NPDC051463 TaxID=3154845 RepID=UPI0034500D4A
MGRPSAQNRRDDGNRPGGTDRHDDTNQLDHTNRFEPTDRLGSSRRLSVVDEIFLRTHRGLGTPVALQGLWRTADAIDPRLLQEVHTALRTGPLGRRVIRPRVPGARRSWRPSTRAHPFDSTTEPIPTETLLDWADGRGADLDPEFGPGWRLSAVALDDGGTLVCLTCSHAIADGRALVLAVDEALRSRAAIARPAGDEHVPPQLHQPDSTPTADHSTTGPETSRSEGGRRRSRSNTTSPANLVTSSMQLPSSTSDSIANSTAPQAHRAEARGGADSTPGRSDSDGSADITGHPANSISAQSDWADAFRQWSIVLRGTARAFRHGVPPRPMTAAADRHRTGSDATPTHSAILQCAASDWDRAALAQGGSANSLFIWVVANILWATGFPRPAIDASLPVDTRDEPRVDNDLAMTEISIDRADTPATIREKSRIAYERRMSSPGGLPEELLQVIPDRWAHALSKGAGERDILCSNIGTLPTSLRTLGPHHCIGVAARAIHPGLTTDRLPRTRLSGYLCRSADDFVLSLVSLDTTAVESSTALRDLARETAEARHLPLTAW